MLRYDNIHKIIRKHGLIPLKNRAIIVTYSGEKLSDKIAKFFSPEFYILQICEEEIVFLPLTQISIVFSINHDFPEELILSIPIDLIENIQVEEKYLEYEIEIDTEDSIIKLLVKEKGLSNMRSTGAFARESLRKHNWHRNNLYNTLNHLLLLKLEGFEMAVEKKLDMLIEELGFIPVEDMRIVVTYGGENLSDRVVKTLNPKFYMLQVCKEDILIIPFALNGMIGLVKKDIDSIISIESIKEIKVEEKGFNYEIRIETNEDTIILSAQQKQLSIFRMTGALGLKSLTKNWHVDNLDSTLEYLRNIKGRD